MRTLVVVRVIAGPSTGEARRLAGGDTWRVGSPPVLLLTALGGGSLRVDPLTDGVRLGGRELAAAETLALGGDAREIALPGGSVLWVAVTTAPEPVASALALELDEDGPVAAAPAPRPPARRQPPRPRLRLRRISLPLRVSRAVLVSVGVHAAIAVLLILLLWIAPRPPEPPPRRFDIRFEGPVAEEPEAREGAAPELDDDPRGESGADAARELPAPDLDETAAALDAEAGRAADPRHEVDGVGIGSAPSGALLAERRGGRERLLREGGGNAALDGALTLAFEWLARHQAPDGTWDAEAFDALCVGETACAGRGEREYREATTALALLPFLGAGHTHLEGPWRRTVRDGLAALLRMQRDDGSFGDDPRRAYASAIGALTLAEAYGLTGSPTLRAPAARSAAYFVERQGENGGWRYDPGDGKADTSVTGWAAIALVSARRAGLPVPARTLSGCRRWMESQCTADGRVGYTGPSRGTDALLGVGIVCRHLLGTDAAGAELAPVARRLTGRRPEWPYENGATGYTVEDPMHWYYGSLAAFHAGGDAWLMWEPRLATVLLDHQATEGCARGSWDAVGSTGLHGGRVVVTALCALTLEVRYRYPRATFGR